VVLYEKPKVVILCKQKPNYYDTTQTPLAAAPHGRLFKDINRTGKQAAKSN
jgi:hypothetical protein